MLVPKLIKISSDSDKQKIMQKYHDDPITGGHPGITRMLKKIRLQFHWKGMTKDIAKHVKNCFQCKANKTTIKGKESLIITPTPLQAFQRVIIDTIGPLPRSESYNEYAVTIMCDLTKYLVAIPIINKSAKNVAKAIMENFILIYGPMTTIVTDLGTEYTNQVLSELCSLMNIEKLHSTAYHHETVGTVERSHRTFNEYLRAYVSEDKSDWDQWLKFFVYCYNTTPSTAHNYCPFELIFGKIPREHDFTKSNKVDPLYNVEAYDKEVRFRLQIAQRRAASLIEKAKLSRHKNSTDRANPITLKVNDSVLIRNESGHKLDAVYKGPYTVIETDDTNNVTITDSKGKIYKVHKNRIKKL